METLLAYNVSESVTLGASVSPAQAKRTNPGKRIKSIVVIVDVAPVAVLGPNALLTPCQDALKRYAWRRRDLITETLR